MARKSNGNGNSNGGPRMPFSASSQGKPNGGKKVYSRANRASKNDPSNAYTYEPSLPKRHRTSEQQLSLTHEEAKAGPSERRRHRKPAEEQNDEEAAEEEEEEMEDRIRKLQMMIAGDEPGQIDEDSEESEIDSDEAWESDGSDEERWGDVFRDLKKDKSKNRKAKGKEVVKKPAKPFTVDLSEGEDEDEEDEPAQPVKAKGKGKAAEPETGDEDEEESEDEFAADRAVADDEDENEDEDEDEDDDEDDDGEEDEEDEDDDDDEEPSDAELPSDLSDDDDEPDTLNGLDSFVDQLDAAQRKTREDKSVVAEAAKTKRRVLPVSSANGRAADGKLDLSTLIASHPSLSGASALLPSKSDNKSSSSSILKQGVLPAPLPTVVQDRLDREAAYEKTKEEGQKWSGAMKRIKEAEHLQFPLQAKDRGGIKSSGEVIGSFKAQNGFEDAITSLLNKANLTESEMTKQEDEALQGQELSLEEIKARRDQLRYQRELMFRAEAKAKRVAKIKSKTYRKLARKRAAKEGGGAGAIDLEDLERLDPEAAAAEREKLERERARERATLRHGAKSGRWARDVGGDGEIEDRRRAKEDMLELKERLQRKIMGQDEGASSDDDEEDDEDEENDDEDAIRAKAFDQLNALEKKDLQAQAAAGGKKGLMQMAFMQKAQDREMKRVAEEEKEARREIEQYGRENDNDESSDEDGDETMVERVGGNEGRMVFTSANKPVANGISAPGITGRDTSDSPEPAQPASTSTRPNQPKKSALSQTQIQAQAQPEVNPWLASTGSAGPSRKKNTQVQTDKASRTLAKSAQAKEAAMDDERVDIQIDVPVSGSGSGSKKRKGNAGGDDDDDEEDGMLPTGLKGFQQRDLVAEAFAGDNVVQDFAADKAKQIEADAPKTEDTSLPGWGSWGGKGAKKRKTNPKFLVKTAGVEPAKRKDFESSNVIITEKKDKKASQFQVKDLPYPYTSIEQYEARFRTPLGSEWNSRTVHQKETMPRVTKKPGAIIEPIRRLF